MSAKDKSPVLTLYHMPTCPYCVKTRRSIKKMQLKLELKDTYRNTRNRQELINGGGKHPVPCLRIVETKGKVRWLYESYDIIKFLQTKV